MSSLIHKVPVATSLPLLWNGLHTEGATNFWPEGLSKDITSQGIEPLGQLTGIVCRPESSLDFP